MIVVLFLYPYLAGITATLKEPKIGQSMASVNGVLDVHDLHVWSICSGHIALSAHVLTADEKITANDGVMTELKKTPGKVWH